MYRFVNGLECEVLFYHLNTTADVDECIKDIDECSGNAYCNNTDGGYWCKCRPGFQGDGYNCTGQIVCFVVNIVGRRYIGMALHPSLLFPVKNT